VLVIDDEEPVPPRQKQSSGHRQSGQSTIYQSGGRDGTRRARRGRRALAHGIRVDTQADEVRLALEMAMPCGLIINELLSNALKHAFRRRLAEAPWIEVALRSQGETCELSVADNGVGLPEGAVLATSDSLGWTLVRALSDPLGGEVELDGTRGVRCTIAFPRS
jgi:two-component sensor histidine kinase